LSIQEAAARLAYEDEMKQEVAVWMSEAGRDAPSERAQDNIELQEIIECEEELKNVETIMDTTFTRSPRNADDGNSRETVGEDSELPADDSLAQSTEEVADDGSERKDVKPSVRKAHVNVDEDRPSLLDRSDADRQPRIESVAERRR
jgi:hypothetical protein